MQETTPHILTVNELTHLIKGTLESNFGAVWVEGEISNFTRAQSGHLYFALKDEYSQVRCVMFRSRAGRLRFEPENGVMTVARGQVTVYAPRGEYQLVVESLEPKGLGALQLAFEQLKRRLGEEGLFDAERKRPIPAMPRTVGVVTSPSGAAIRDIINVVRRRFASVRLLLYPVRVQGAGAAREIAEGIRQMNRRGDVDVLIVGRGGGSLEDLWAFNEEEVARAVHASRIPVISAVGHEIDFTICDFTADLRAPTPSAAAELVVKDRANLVREVDSLRLRLRGAVQEVTGRGRSRLAALASRPVLARAESFLLVPRQRLDEARLGLARVFRNAVAAKRFRGERLLGRLRRFHPGQRLAGFRKELSNARRALGVAAGSLLDARRRHLGFLNGKLDALSPLAVLGRGYSICRTLPEGRVVTAAAQVAEGDAVNVLLQRGSIDCRVTAVTNERREDAER